MKLSIIIPWHFMQNWQFFLTRCLESIEKQSFKDYEVILTKAGSMPINTNRAINCAQGELIKILYVDDYLAHENALQVIVDAFEPEDTWLATGCLHQKGNETPNNPHLPKYYPDIHTGNNTIGSPSVITLRNEGKLLFDEKLSYLLDCDLYKRYFDTYGPPKLINDMNVIIGIGEHQTSNIMSEEQKFAEVIYSTAKHA